MHTVSWETRPLFFRFPRSAWESSQGRSSVPNHRAVQAAFPRKHTSFPRATWECRVGRAASRIRDVARDSRRSAP